MGDRLEGELWKWTNYWNGWQSRWFILDDGVISYYKSFDEVSQGCKGSISLNVCEIVVNPSDPTRLDLNVSNEQYLYLRANNEKERQQWLVALGSAKAGMANRQQRRRISSTTSTLSDMSTNQAIPQHLIIQNNENRSTSPVAGASIAPNTSAANALKSKKSELRLYCDLLMQQVHTIKTGAEFPANSNPKEDLPHPSPVENSSNNDSHLLTATCDTFINTLDELMDLADTHFNIYAGGPLENGTRRNSRERSTTPQTMSPPNPQIYVRQTSSNSNRPRLASESNRTSPTILETDEEGGDNFEDSDGFKALFGGNCNKEDRSSSSQSTPSKKGATTTPSPQGYTPSPPDSRKTSNHKNSSSSFPLKKQFPQPQANGELKTSDFISAALKILTVYDFLGKTFVPIKTEVKGHVKGLETRFLSSNEITFEYIVDIIEAEKVSKKSNMPSSATSALVWIMRNLMFLHHFLRTYVESECSIKECLRLSYENTLMKNHEQTIRNVFAVAIQTAPSRSIFTQSFGMSDPSEITPLLAEYLENLDRCLITLKRNLSTM